MHDPAKVVWDYALITEITIERVAKEVWPYFFEDKKSLWSNVNYAPVTGQSEHLGEKYSMVSAAHDATWYFETIRINRCAELVLKITRCTKDQPEEALLGYDLFELKESAGQTAVAFQQAFSMPVAASPDQLAEFTRGADRHHAEILQKLKRLVEGK